MIEVFKIIHNYYDTGASVKLNFNAVGSTRGNTFKLRKDMCRYDITKYSCCYLVVNVEKSRTARSDKNTNSCLKTLIKQLLSTYSITDCTAYAATVPLRYTNRPFVRRRRNTKRLTVVLLSAAKQPCQNAIRFVRLPLWRTSNADELMTIMCALELGRLYKTTRFGADKASRK